MTSFFGTKSRSFGFAVKQGDIIEVGVFRRGKLDGYGMRLSKEGRVYGSFDNGNVHGVAYSFLASEKLGMVAEYNENGIVRVLTKNEPPNSLKIGSRG